ncbi:MAG: AsnC family transcriptional regulator [Proteobacteria bacterium]|nr:AsnC family transcriptional regulator [Pseudomonadota bacterium]
MDTLDQRLLNDFQRDFPLVDRPFAAIGRRAGASEEDVLARYARMVEAGTVSRIGVVFAPHAVGASTLAAMAVPPDRIEEVAQIVNAQPETNHNYEREHRLNLWFVLTAPTQLALDASIARIERAAGLPVLALPLLEEFHIDLGFDMEADPSVHGALKRRGKVPVRRRPQLSAQARKLVAAVQGGFPLQARPFEAVAREAGCTPAVACAMLAAWLADGVARRIGVVVRHGSLGYAANAMVVWDVPDADVPEVAGMLAAHPETTLCYRRPRRRPEWPYNLFCMIHGRDRESVLATLEQLRLRLELVGIPYEVLFSTRCFRQRGARYAEAA